MSSDSDKLGAFLSGRRKLLQITLPAKKHLPDNIQTIYIEASGNRSEAHKAELTSMATRTETVAQGESYYFQTSDKNIITGMNVTAWIPEQNVQRAGIIIPKSALIWYLDQALVYIRTTEETFSRRTIDHYFQQWLADILSLTQSNLENKSLSRVHKCCYPKSCGSRFPAWMTIKQQSTYENL